MWDLRTGRSVMTLQGHVKPVLALDFSPNGYQLVSGSEDHTARVWDLRRRQSLYTVPAHSSTVSQVGVTCGHPAVPATAIDCRGPTSLVLRLCPWKKTPQWTESLHAKVGASRVVQGNACSLC